MITTSNPKLTRTHLREALGDRTDRVSFMFYPTADCEKQYKKRGLFVAHLIKEGIPLYDQLGLLRQVRSEPFVPNAEISEEIAHFRSELAPYKFPERYKNNFSSASRTRTPSANQSSSSLWPATAFSNSTARPPFAALLP